MLTIAFPTFLLFFYLAYRRPVLALFSASAVLPAYLLRFTVFGLPSTILEFIIWGVFLGWVFSLLWKKISPFGKGAVHPLPPFGKGGLGGILGGNFSLLKTRLQKIKYPLALFFIASVISIFVAPDLWTAVGRWRAFFLEPLMIFLMILAVVSPTLLPLSKGEERGGGEKIIFGLSVSAIYISAISIGQKFFGLPNPFLENAARASSIFPQPNMLGLYLAPIIILIIGRLISNFQFLISNKITNYKLQITKIIYWILVIIISFAAIIFAESDGAIIGVLAGFTVFFILFLPMQNVPRPRNILHNIKIILIFLVPIFLFFIFYFLFLNNNLFFEIKSKLLLRDWSGTVRLQIWRESWTMLKDNWLWGAGISGYPIKILPYHASREWMDVYPAPHNIIFNFWSELGILGLAAFLWLLEKFFRMCYHLLKHKKLLAITAIATMAALLIHGLVDAPFFKNDLSILFWIIYSIPLIASSRI